jgi:glutamyl-tRNA reductase
MQISVTGLSHHDTPVELRELFAFTPEQLAPALAHLPAGLGGAALLSTCNRTELYLAAEDAVSSNDVIAALASVRGVSVPEGAHFFHLERRQAVEHLFGVAAGIDSLVIGESEILGQVREAFSAATTAQSGNPVLARLFHAALRAGRRARTETEIGAHGLSVAALAVSLSRKVLGDLRRKTVLVVGAGEMGQRSAAALVQHGVGRLIVMTRRSGLAEEIARQLNGVAPTLDQLPQALVEADVVISCTAATEPIIGAADITSAMDQRRARPLLIVDIAVPRDVESNARHVAGVHLYDIDDLEAAAEANLEARKREVEAVESIVADEALRFETWLDTRRVTPTIAALRKRAEETRRAEVERTLARMPALSDADRSRIEAMSKALVNRLLHDPVTRLRHSENEHHLDAIHALFDLHLHDDEPP